MFSFCRPVSSKKRFSPHRKLDSEFSFTLFEKAARIPVSDWEIVTSNQTVFLNPGYLGIVEKCFHTRLQCRYVVVYRKEAPCGVIYFQIVDFKAGLFGRMISHQVEDLRQHKLNLFERYLHSNKEEILLRLFTCGNNLVSGEYGFCFDKKTGKEKSHYLLLTITDLIAREEKLRGTISATLLKDFSRPLRPERLFAGENFSRFSVEPNMVVEVPPRVSSLADYVALFSKKYRSRARSIFRKIEGIEKRTLSGTMIKDLEKDMYALYAAVFEKAKFRLMQLPLNYFSKVKELFSERFIVNAYFRNNQMIAFSSCFVMPDSSVEAHYIGLDYAANEEHELYQNILYSLIEEGITRGCSRVNLGRTAAEIKTTVGAKPHELLCYIKPQNTISKLIQRPFISFLQPAPWTARNPFREDQPG